MLACAIKDWDKKDAEWNAQRAKEKAEKEAARGNNKKWRNQHAAKWNFWKEDEKKDFLEENSITSDDLSASSVSRRVYFLKHARQYLSREPYWRKHAAKRESARRERQEALRRHDENKQLQSVRMSIAAEHMQGPSDKSAASDVNKAASDKNPSEKSAGKKGKRRKRVGAKDDLPVPGSSQDTDETSDEEKKKEALRQALRKEDEDLQAQMAEIDKGEDPEQVLQWKINFAKKDLEKLEKAKLAAARRKEEAAGAEEGEMREEVYQRAAQAYAAQAVQHGARAKCKRRKTSDDGSRGTQAGALDAQCTDDSTQRRPQVMKGSAASGSKRQGHQVARAPVASGSNYEEAPPPPPPDYILDHIMDARFPTPAPSRVVLQAVRQADRSEVTPKPSREEDLVRLASSKRIAMKKQELKDKYLELQKMEAKEKEEVANAMRKEKEDEDALNAFIESHGDTWPPWCEDENDPEYVDWHRQVMKKRFEAWKQQQREDADYEKAYARVRAHYNLIAPRYKLLRKVW